MLFRQIMSILIIHECQKFLAKHMIIMYFSFTGFLHGLGTKMEEIEIEISGEL